MEDDVKGHSAPQNARLSVHVLQFYFLINLNFIRRFLHRAQNFLEELVNSFIANQNQLVIIAPN